MGIIEAIRGLKPAEDRLARWKQIYDHDRALGLKVRALYQTQLDYLAQVPEQKIEQERLVEKVLSLDDKEQMAEFLLSVPKAKKFDFMRRLMDRYKEMRAQGLVE